MTEERVPYSDAATTRETYAVRDSGGDLRKYRIELPNLIDDMELSIHAFRLYVHLKRVAGSEGECFQSTETLAKHCRMSTGMISNAKKELVSKNLIALQKRDRARKETDLITIVDLWPENFAAYAAEKRLHVVNPLPVCDDERVHVVKATGSCGEGERVHVVKQKKEPNTTIKKEPNKEEDGATRPTTQEKPLTPQQEMFGAICEAVGWDYRVIGEDDTKLIAKTGKILREAGYTAEDIRSFVIDIWFKDWRWTKHQQYPTIKSLREGIGNLRSIVKNVAPQQPKKGMDAYRSMGERLGIEL